MREEGVVMSVDCSACLRYGWFLLDGEVTEQLRRQVENDFEGDAFFGCLNGKYEKTLGHYYVNELVSRADDYREDSPYCIGVEIDTDRRVYDDDGKLCGFESMTAKEFAEEVSELALLDDVLEQLYVDVMGVRPERKPTVHLYESWW